MKKQSNKKKLAGEREGSSHVRFQLAFFARSLPLALSMSVG
jgi:hypothetical protein